MKDNSPKVNKYDDNAYEDDNINVNMHLNVDNGNVINSANMHEIKDISAILEKNQSPYQSSEDQ